MSMLASFYVITSTQITLKRYMEARNFLGQIHRSSVNIVHMVNIITMDDMSQEAKEYRYNVRSC